MTLLRIWNLRRGDDDDNRSSPYGGGFRSLILPTLLEFNYLKAPLAFFTLVIGPALLVGIAPSLVVTYGRLAFHAVSVAGRNPVYALGLMVILVGTALWIARPLLVRAFVEFRYLHYALVFPIFVAVRELLRTITERFFGPSITQQQLGRSRRWGTIAAALLFAAGGLALAITMEFTIGLKLIDVEHVQVWPAIKAALGNAAVILGLSTAFESLYWLWREVSLSGPALDWVPGKTPAAGSTLRIAHLSDLHLVGERYGCRMETGTHGPRGNRSFRNALRELAAIDAAAPLDYILVTGDVTDAGTRGEWTQFLDLLRASPALRNRVSFVPGNHDVNIVDRTNPARMDLPWSASQALRKLRFVLALDDVEGDRVRLVDRTSGTLGPTLKDYLREGQRMELLRALADRGAIRGRWEIAKTWDAIFPLVTPPQNGNGCGLILLDSNAPSHFSLTNAIGMVSPRQLKALKLLLKNFPQHAWLILLHHQVVEYPIPSISLRDRVGLALVNAPDVLAAVAPHASRVLVLHGHRHTDWIGTSGDVVLGSAPSVALGSDHGKHQGSFHVHEISLEAEGNLRLMTTERVKVA